MELSAETTKVQDNPDICNLTAEIQTFVRSADTDKEILGSKTTSDSCSHNMENEIVVDVRHSPERNEYHQEEITIERIQNLGEIDENSDNRCKKSPVKILIRAATDEEQILQVEEEFVENDTFESVQTNAEAIRSSQELSVASSAIDTEIENTDVDNNEILESNTEAIQNSKDDSQEFSVASSISVPNLDEELAISTEIENSNVAKNETVNSAQTNAETIGNSISDKQEINVSTNIECIGELKTYDNTQLLPENAASGSIIYLKETELKITESLDNLTQIEQTQSDVANEKRSVNTFEFPESSARIDKTVIINKNVSTKVPPAPPQRRRSVKEIIESINKCQKMLKINHDVPPNKVNNTDLYQTSPPSSSKTFGNKQLFIDRNINDAVRKEYQSKRLFTDMTEVNNNAKDDEQHMIPLFVERFNELNNNDSHVLFEKCATRRTEDDKQSITESRWNPVPKPRRHHKKASYD